MEEIKENEVAKKIVDAALEVHRTLGPGLLEAVYEEALAHELTQRGMSVERQVAIPVRFKGIYLDCGYRADLIVEGLIIIEVKSVESLAPIHFKQLLTYLRLSKKRLGFVINFNVILLKQGIKRIVNNL
jgi:GxxExxY protein